jgi:hypothetical protein
VASEPPRLGARWIRPGTLDAALLEWFRRFPVAPDSREDECLVSPRLDGLLVKILAARALEVRSCLGPRGVLTVAGQAQGCPSAS